MTIHRIETAADREPLRGWSIPTGVVIGRLKAGGWKDRIMSLIERKGVTSIPVVLDHMPGELRKSIDSALAELVRGGLAIVRVQEIGV